jgi:hypothetical protein
MVTPGISGLVNGDALQGLWQNGLQCATGDNTWAHLKNPDNVHQMLYTTQVRVPWSQVGLASLVLPVRRRRRPP